MVTKDDTYVLQGPDNPVSNETLGKELYRYLLEAHEGDLVKVDAYTGAKLTYSKLLDDSCNLAEALRNAGYQKDCVIGLCSENNLQYFTIFCAVQFNATPLTLFNPTSTEDELSKLLEIAKPKIVFCSINQAVKLVKIKSEKSYIEKIIVTQPIMTIIRGTERLVNFINDNTNYVSPYTYDIIQVEPKKNIALILYSSGTTGFPKGVALSHYNINGTMSFEFDATYPSNKSNLGILPFYHIYGLLEALYAIKFHHRIFVFTKFDTDLFLNIIQNHKIQSISITPSLAVFLIKSEKVKRYDFSHLKEILCGAAALKKETELELRKRFKNVIISQGYGMTETSSIGTFGNAVPGSVGKIAPLMSCKIRDPETGKSLGPFTNGELCFKGPLIMIGYYNNEKANREIFTSDGWLRTGDIAYYDDDGNLFIVDRIKELIKYKGHQVAPAEIEAVLLSHPKITDAAVVGIPDESAGELPIALVVKEEESNVTEQEIQQYVAGKVAPQKHLRGGVMFVSAIPKNSLGKIQRKKLREIAIANKQSSKSKL